MAKTRLKNRWVVMPRGTENMRAFNIRVEVARLPTTVTARGRAPHGDAFIACARVASQRADRTEIGRVMNRECNVANNPRKAVAKALTFLTRKINRRGGAFRGVK